ncbi:MAG: CAP domain-containing protein [Pseudomonadota bacterium]
MALLLASVPSHGVAQQWIDVRTGQTVTSLPVITHDGKTDWIRPDIADRTRAFDPRSGRNFHYDAMDCRWKDSRTGKAVTSLPVITHDGNTDWIRPDIADRTRAYDPRSGRNFAQAPCPPRETTSPNPTPPAPPVGQTGSTPPVRLRATDQRILDIQNAERVAVGAQPLRWNPQLATGATAWAQQLARIGQLVHAPREGRGIARENLSQGLLGWGPDQLLTNWIKEKQRFTPGLFPNVARDGNWLKVAHYTQMIWPATTDLGCGMADGRGYRWLVCRYSPGGNKDGQPVGQPAVATATSKTPASSGGWIDVKTGERVASYPVITDPTTGKTHWIRPDVTDRNRAYDPRTGRNFARDKRGKWIDVKTGEPVVSYPVITDRTTGKTDWIRPDITDRDRAYDPRTGRNFAREPAR